MSFKKLEFFTLITDIMAHAKQPDLIFPTLSEGGLVIRDYAPTG